MSVLLNSKEATQMQKRYLNYAAAIASVLVLTYCSSGNVDSIPSPTVSVKPKATLTVPGITSAVTCSFDLGAYDPLTNTYYVTDRTNKSLDVVNLNTLAVTGQFKAAFAGCNSSTGTTRATPIALPGCNTITATPANYVTDNDASGPDGLDVVGGTSLYAGDVSALWVFNKTTGAQTAKIAIPTFPVGSRADEGCWDSVNNIYAISTPGSTRPFMTFLDTTVPAVPTVIATVAMNDSTGAASGGLEGCFFLNGRVWVNNDGTTANPDGEVNSIPVSAINALKAGAPHNNITFQGGLAADGVTAGVLVAPACAAGVFPAGTGTVGPVACPAGTIVFPLITGCTPTGLAPGPVNAGGFTELGTMCRPNPPARLDFVILNMTSGQIYAQMAGLGGGDQITYDAASQKWFLANSRHTGNGISCGAGTAVTCPLSPALTVVRDDGIAAPSLVAHVDNGNNAHSVAVGGGYVIMPFSNPTGGGGGANFPNGGINIWKTSQF
jgi:hypothetical protein